MKLQSKLMHRRRVHRLIIHGENALRGLSLYKMEQGVSVTLDLFGALQILGFDLLIVSLLFFAC